MDSEYYGDMQSRYPTASGTLNLAKSGSLCVLRHQATAHCDYNANDLPVTML